MAGQASAYQVCIGNLSLHRINRLPYYQNTGPAIKVNQVGYLPDGPKVATLLAPDTAPVQWQLRDSANNVIASGMSKVFGNDTATRQNTHTIDFTSYAAVGSGYTLTTSSAASYPFTISESIYVPLRQDSMQFFYQQRSGIEILASLVGSQYARPAGHLNIPPNTGDVVTPCQYEWESIVTCKFYSP